MDLHIKLTIGLICVIFKSIASQNIDIDAIILPKEWFDVNNVQVSPPTSTIRIRPTDQLLKKATVDLDEVQFIIKKYVKLLLQSLALKDSSFENEQVKQIIVDIQLTVQQINKLKNSLEKDSLTALTRAIDEVFHDRIQIKSTFTTGYLDNIVDSAIWKWFMRYVHMIKIWANSSDALYVYCGLSSFIFYLLCSRNVWSNILFFLNSLVLIDGLKMYWILQNEREAEDYWALKKLESVNCNSDQISTLNSWFRSLIHDPCKEKFLQTIKKSEISLPKCLLETYFHLMVEFPLSILGSGLSEFNKKVSASFPWPFNIVAHCVFIGLFITIVLPSLFSLLCGKKIKISSFLGNFELGDKNHEVLETERIQEIKPEQLTVQMPPVNINLTLTSSELAGRIQLMQSDSISQTNTSQMKISSIPSSSIESLSECLNTEIDDISTTNIKKSLGQLDLLRAEIIRLNSSLQDLRPNHEMESNMSEIKSIFSDLKEIMKMDT